MVLKNKIQEDIKEALKAKKEIETSTLRQLLAVVLNKEKEKRYKISKAKPDLSEQDLEKESQFNDQELVEAIFSEVKKRKEAILEFSAYAEGYGGPAVAPKIGAEAGRKEKIENFINKEKREMEILQKYLPEQLSEEELKKLVKDAIDKTGAKEMKDTGKIMAELMPKVKGKADGSQISRIVKELLS